MEKYWSREFYNPHAIYAEGERARRAVEDCRLRIARLLGAAPECVIFTSGGTEANVLAVRAAGGRVEAEPGAHPSVIEAAGDSVSTWQVDTADDGKTKLISSVAQSNALGRRIREERRKRGSSYPLLHIDASQSAAYVRVGLEALACDLLTLDAAKMYGPKGVGALVVRKGVELDLPPRGTPPVPLIAGFAKAFELAARDREAESKRLSTLSEQFAESLRSAVPQSEVSTVYPNIVNVSVPGVLPELLVLALEREGVLVSAGPACNAMKPEPAETPVRFSLGRRTTRKELNKAVKSFCRAVKNVLK